MQQNSLEEYKNFIKSFTKLHNEAKKIPLGESISAKLTSNPDCKVLIFSPHPDDECVVGALPLRLKNELKAEVINVAVTLGSNTNRKAGRLKELKAACSTLGFHLYLPAENGLDKVSLDNRENSKHKWQYKVSIIKNLLLKEQPRAVFFPHDNDFNSTHIGVHHLVTDALQLAMNEDSKFSTDIFESEFWQMMDEPNLLIGLSEEDEALLVYALAAHTEEVQRNPYHINHPARMLDNVMRGAEVIGGQGEHAPNMDFAMIYRHSIAASQSIKAVPENKVFDLKDSLNDLLN